MKSLHSLSAAAEGLSTSHLVALVCTDQRERWSSGDRVESEQYLELFPALAADSELAVEIAYHEYLLCEEQGEPPDPSSFVARFPGIAPALTKQLDVHQGLQGVMMSALAQGNGTQRAAVSTEPRRLGGYELSEQIADRTAARLYKAISPDGAVVAIKVLSEQLVSSSRVVDRFFREADALARLDHPHIARILDLGQDGRDYFYVTEFVEGWNLTQMVETNGPLAIPVALQYLLQAADGLAHAHSHGVIHRDVKPANLMVNMEGRVKVVDLGLARVTSTNTPITRKGDLLGSLDFMSPEQARNPAEADERADVYSLGCTFYWTLTGRHLFGGKSLREKLEAVLQAPTPTLRATRRDVSPELEKFFAQLVAKRPEERLASMQAVMAAAQEFLPPPKPSL